MSNILFTSDKNYLKRDTSSGSATINAPATPTSYFNFATTYTVNHNLGYIPQVRVYFENSASDGKIYPSGGRRISGAYVGLPANSIFCLYELTTTTLTIYLESATSKTGTRDIHWVIYRDS